MKRTNAAQWSHSVIVIGAIISFGPAFFTMTPLFFLSGFAFYCVHVVKI
jgi:hypothetical protein